MTKPPDDIKQLNFWRTMANSSLNRLVGVEGLVALALTAGPCWLLFHRGNGASRLAASADMMSITGALIGITFAAFTLVITLIDDRYLVELNASCKPGGVLSFLAPFLLNIGIQAGLLLLLVAYRAVGTFLLPWAEGTVFCLASGLFVFAVLNLVTLAKDSLAHGITRGQVAEIKLLEEISQARRRNST